MPSGWPGCGAPAWGRGAGSGCSSLSLRGDPAGDEEVDDREDDDDEEEHPRDGCGPAEVLLGPAPLGGVEGRAWPRPVAAAEAVLVVHPRLVEDLQPADGRGDDDEDDGGAQLRDGDWEEGADASGSVDHGGLVVVAGDRLHGGEEDQGVVTGPAEVDHRRDGDVAGQDLLVPLDRVDADEA